jgi:hypothetical protein
VKSSTNHFSLIVPPFAAPWLVKCKTYARRIV